MTQTLHDSLGHVVKDTPPIAVGAITLFGVELSNWVLILTAIYTIIRIISEVRSWYIRKQDDRNPTVLDSRDSDNPNK